MKGIAFYFMLLAVLAAVLGMGWGIQMSASHSYTLAPAHAHLNLVGWVSMALFAFYYHAVPSAAGGILPKLHLGAAFFGVTAMVPGIVMALRQQGETFAKVGAILTLISMLIFLAVVLMSRARD